MPFATLQHKSSLTRRTLGILVALCLLVTPVISMATDLHELSHGAQHLQAGHEVTDPDHGDAPDGVHAVLHGVHVCDSGVGIPPSLVPVILSGVPVSVFPQLDTRRGSAGTNLLFRPPRQN